MIISKIEHLLGSFTIYSVSVLAFIFLGINSVSAQIDSLKTDSTITVITEPLIVNDSIVETGQSDTITGLTADTTFLIPKMERKIPARSALYSMILPGLGQAYNGKYWKIPIIYTLLGSMYYFAADNHQKYEDFKFAFKNFDNEEQKPEWVNESITDKKYLEERMIFYKRNRDLNIIIGVMFYLFNILDANVDAHLMNFDVSEDLSLRIEPDINNYYAIQKKSNVSGFGIKFVLSLNR